MTDTNRERRADAWEKKAGLTEPQIWQVFEWARSLGQRKARILIQEEFKLDPPSAGSFSEWYEYMSAIAKETRILQMVTDNAALRDMANAADGSVEDLEKLLANQAKLSILSENPDLADLFTKLTVRVRDSRRRETALKVAVAKAERDLKTAVEHGLDQLATEIQNNPDAQKYYDLFRAAILKTLTEAA